MYESPSLIVRGPVGRRLVSPNGGPGKRCFSPWTFRIPWYYCFIGLRLIVHWTHGHEFVKVPQPGVESAEVRVVPLSARICVRVRIG